jgi:cysteine desulfurase
LKDKSRRGAINFPTLLAVPYFDHNATHPLSPAARAAWLEAVERYPANASSPHRLGMRSDSALQRAREQLAGMLGCSPLDIVWTSGATEANNAVLHHFASTIAPDAQLWISAIEHPCMFAAARRWLPQRHQTIPVKRQGVVDLGWLEEQMGIRPPAAVAVMAANNETGVLQPWSDVLEICRRHDVPFVCDAAQWIGKLPASGLGACHFVTGCAHKFGGPPGVGFLKCPEGFKPLLVGGPQEDGRRAGTENLPGVLSMLAALVEREQAIRDGAVQQLTEVRERFETKLQAAVPSIEIVGRGSPRLWNTVAALMPPAADCRQRWVVKLDKLGFSVSTGSACASGKEQPSHVLAAMGYAEDQSDRMLRFSSGWETPAEDWMRLVEAVASVSATLH